MRAVRPLINGFTGGEAVRKCAVIFVDTSFFYAHAYARDAHHLEAVKFLELLPASFIHILLVAIILRMILPMFKQMVIGLLLPSPVLRKMLIGDLTSLLFLRIKGLKAHLMPISHKPRIRKPGQDLKNFQKAQRYIIASQ